VSDPAIDSASLVGDAAARILRDLADPQTLNRAKDDSWRKPAWAALEEAGLTLAWVPDAGWRGSDFRRLCRAAEAGRSPCPAAGRDAAGRWLLSRAGIAVLRAP
jgi:hypothetical protein